MGDNGLARVGNPQRFQAVMQAYPRENIETCRNIINDRYEAMICALWPKVVKGSLSAIDRVTRICEAQAKLNGANNAEKLDVSAGAAELDAALRALEAELRLRAQGQPVPEE